MENQRPKEEKRLLEMTRKWVEEKGSMLFAPISMQQFATSKDFPAKGPQWVSRDVLKKPSHTSELSSLVLDAVCDLGTGEEQIGHILVEDVKIQWTAFRPSAGPLDREPSISEEDKYRKLMNDTGSRTTILYAHGGFY